MKKLSQQPENINLIRRIAWSFNATTGINIEDLIGEATLAYYEAAATHDPSKGAITTWAYTHMQNHLINFCKRQQVYTTLDTAVDIAAATATPFSEITELLSAAGAKLVSKILATPENYVGKSSKAIRGQLVKELKEEGWSWPQIWSTFDEVKDILAHN